jgi:serine/threonine-protein kinase
LLQAGLLGDESELPDVTITFGPVMSSVLSSFGEAFGSIPPVLLRDSDSITDPGPVIQPSSPEIPDAADRSARLQLFGEIARGGMGAVLKGRDCDLGRDLAVKILLESHRNKPEMIRRFIEEAQIAGQLQHPGIVPIYELGAFGERRPYFAMKLVKGHTLAELFARRKTPGDGLPRFLSIFESICQTMAYAHARGVIHRDLKPSNVMVGSFGEVQVMDWGLAKVLARGGAIDDASAGRAKDQGTVIATARTGAGSDQSQPGSIMGTPSYMAPEQARGEVDQVDERADVFALGSILCELMTGQPAFNGRSPGEIQRKAARGELAEAFSRLEQNSPGHDLALISLARYCLALEREDRPRNAGEVAETVTLYHSRVQERLHEAEITQAEEKARAEEATKRVAVERQRTRLTVALAASLLVLMLLGGSGGFWVYQQRQSRLTALETTLARIETLREQAISDGAESPRRREALVAADLALASLGNLAQSDRGLRLAALRDDLAAEQEQAERGQKLLAELESIRPRRSQQLEQWEPKADRQFSQAFRRHSLDLDTTSSEVAIRTLNKLPAPIRRGLVSNLDRWIVIRHDHSPEPSSNGVALPLHRILDVIKDLDPDPERNRMRAFLLRSDLQPLLASLQETASQPSLLDSGPQMPLLLSRLLSRAGDPKAALRVLRRSVLRYPGDLWTNLDLANQNDDAADALLHRGASPGTANGILSFGDVRVWNVQERGFNRGSKRISTH